MDDNSCTVCGSCKFEYHDTFQICTQCKTELHDDDQLCDVCEKPTNNVCGNCHQAVYCSTACQSEHRELHEQVCTHINDMTEQEIESEIQLCIDEKLADPAMLQIGQEIIASQLYHDNGRQWLTKLVQSNLIGATGMGRNRYGLKKKSLKGRKSKFLGGFKRGIAKRKIRRQKDKVMSTYKKK